MGKVKKILSRTYRGLITAWSFSRWSTYEECPRKAKYKYIDKLKEPSSEAMERGAMMHEQAEFYVRGHTKVYPRDFSKKLKKNFDALRAGYKRGLVKVELEIALDRAWQLTSWFGKDAWFRGKADSFDATDKRVLISNDYKSGKLKDDRSIYDEQLELYGVTSLLAAPAVVEKTVGKLWFLDAGKIIDRPLGEVLREEVPERLEKWEGMIAPMLNDRRFAPRPGYYCRYCHFSRNKNGPCQY